MKYLVDERTEQHEGLYVVKKRPIYKPSINGYKVHCSDARFKCLVKGRRFGGTHVLANEGIRHAVENPKSNCVFVSPIYTQVLNVAKIVNFYLPKHFIYHKYKKPIKGYLTDKDEDLSESTKYLHFNDYLLRNGSRLGFRTGVKSERLKGEGYDWAGLNEAAYLQEMIYTEVLRPALADRNGSLFAESSPNGKNWYWHLFLNGQKGSDTYDERFESWQFTSYDGGHITREEFEDLKRTMPERVYNQEILAEFVDNASKVFPSQVISQCVLPGSFSYQDGKFYQFEDFNPNHYYFIGVDIAKSKDWFVLVVFDRDTQQVVAFWRFQHRSYDHIYEAICMVEQIFHRSEIIIDSTGVGVPTLERLQSIYGDLVTGYHFTYQSKKDLIESLIIRMEKGVVKFPSIPVLVKELDVFEYEINLDTGRIDYKHPANMHDDCVIALALAVKNFDSIEWGLVA